MQAPSDCFCIFYCESLQNGILGAKLKDNVYSISFCDETKHRSYLVSSVETGGD